MYMQFLLCLQGSDFVFECVHNHSTNNVGGDVMVQQSLNLATDNKNARMSRVSRCTTKKSEMEICLLPSSKKTKISKSMWSL